MVDATRMTAITPPVRVDVTMVRTLADEETITVTISNASFESAFDQVARPWLGWLAFSPFGLWLAWARVMWAPMLAIIEPEPFAVSVTAHRPGRRCGTTAPPPPAAGEGRGPVLDAEYRRVE